MTGDVLKTLLQRQERTDTTDAIVSVRLCVGAVEVVFQNVLSSIWCLVCALILASFTADL